jgi:hypothetical protein
MAVKTEAQTWRGSGQVYFFMRKNNGWMGGVLTAAMVPSSEDVLLMAPAQHAEHHCTPAEKRKEERGRRGCGEQRE